MFNAQLKLIDKQSKKINLFIDRSLIDKNKNYPFPLDGHIFKTRFQTIKKTSQGLWPVNACSKNA